jgi:hypothetical protein
MAFGLLGAPMHFQFVMDDLLGSIPDLSAVCYLDDVTTHGNQWEAVW